jgi:hypothetical protein
MPATREEKLPPIAVGAWTRVGAQFQGMDSSKVNDWKMDSAYVELHAGGKIHKKVGVTLNLAANMVDFGSATSAGSFVAVEDAIISFDFMDEFHFWAGYLLVLVDRANSAGPFFMIPWVYPGVAVGALPKEGPLGRNNGAVVWGDVATKLTYLVGVFDNANLGTSPLFSGRLRLALLDPEPGFWGNATYFGDKDIFSIGLGGQFQKDGSGMSKNYGEFNADILFEKKLSGGWVTAEGAYYFYNVNDGGLNNSLYLLGAYATPVIGVGNIQPSVRYQLATVKGGGGTTPWNLDAAVSYLIKGPALRLIATYSYTKTVADTSANAIFLSAQAIFF